MSAMKVKVIAQLIDREGVLARAVAGGEQLDPRAVIKDYEDIYGISGVTVDRLEQYLAYWKHQGRN